MIDTVDRINDLEEECLAYAIKCVSPTLAVPDFIGMLGTYSTWSNDELAEVTRRVIDKLGERASRARFPNDPKPMIRTVSVGQTVSAATPARLQP